jgi:hypothetical protein
MSKSKRAPAAPTGGSEEWVVGRVPLPIYVAEPEPVRPDMIFCTSSSGQMIGATPVRPETTDDEAAAEILGFSRDPAVGPPRVPRRIRVASPSFRDALAKSFGGCVEIVLAATPEVDALTKRFVAEMPWGKPRGVAAAGPGEGYLSGGRIDPALVRGLFEAAERLHRATPWAIVPHDGSVVGVDVPSLGIAGLCVAVIGRKRERRCLVAFASRADVDRFAALAAIGEPSGTMGAAMLVLYFERLDELSPRMRDEIAAHGFPLAGPEAAPVLMRSDADDVARPLVADDFVLGRILAAGVAGFFERHRAWPSQGEAPIVDRVVLDEVPDRPEVVITAAAERASAAPRAPKPALRDLRAVRPTTAIALSRVCAELWGPEFVRRFRDELKHGVGELLVVMGPGATIDDVDEAIGALAQIWCACWRPMRDGRTGLQVARSWSKLSAPVLAAAVDRLEAARGVLVEVVSVTAAGRLLMRDLFDGTIYRVAATHGDLRRRLTRWTRVFGVLADVGDGSWEFLGDVQRIPHAVELTPEKLVSTARAALPQLGRDPDDIDPQAPHAGLARWSAVACAALIGQSAPREAAKPRYLVNVEGERIELHTAELVLSKPARTRLLTALALDESVAITGPLVFTWVMAPSPGDPVVDSVATLAVGPKSRLETNSAERYARFLAVVEQLAGEKPVVASLERTRPWESGGDMVEHDGPGVERTVISATLARSDQAAHLAEHVLASMRRRLDETVPALGGVPRALVATEAGRAAVEAWLHEAERDGVPPSPEGEAFLDLDPLRVELGLPTVGAGLGP